jgi:hypothetical protein
LQVGSDPLADGIEHNAHDAIPPGGLSDHIFVVLIMVESRCNLVHAKSLSIMIDLP